MNSISNVLNQLDINNLIRKHRLNASKSLGQNYIIDTSITDNMVRSIGTLENALVLEIGPGVGTLTASILAMSKAEKLLCIEKDKQFKPILDEIVRVYSGRVDVVYEDALKIDVLSLANQVRKENNISKIFIVANLPYNIGTTLFCNWLDYIYEEANNKNESPIESITVMLQKEVVDRITAKENNKNYGWLSIFAQWLCHVEKIFDVQPDAFWPKPKVVSTILHAKPRINIDLRCTKENLRMICQEAFKERRKVISNSMKKFANYNDEIATYLTDNSNKRAEEISVSDFIRIASMIDK